MSKLNRSLLTTLAALAVSPAALAGAVQDAASDFAVPSFDVRSASVFGQDLLTYDSAGNMSMNLGADYAQASQTPTESIGFGGSLNINGSGADGVDTAFSEVIVGGGWYQKYLGDDPRGISIMAGAALTVTNGVDGGDQTGDLAGAVGAGYGRMVDARTVAQASAIYDALGRDAAAADLARVAEVIGNRGSYTIEHKADGEIEFFKALGEALGGTDAGETFKAAQVLDSPIYNISSRNVGWDVAALVGFAYGDFLADGDAAMTADLTQTANYGMLMSDTMGLTVSQSLTRDLVNSAEGAEVDGTMTLTVDAGVNMDHSTQWNSSAGLGIEMIIPDGDGDSVMNWGLGAITNYALGSTTVASAYMNAGAEGDADLTWDLGVNFTYFLL